jgi:DNA-binding LacI/PurR family transcriptional regulator
MLSGVQAPSLNRVRRIQGFRQAMIDHDLPIVEEWIIPNVEPTFECGYEATKQLLTQHPRVTAIFAYNDLLALGAIRACHDLRRSIPGDCAIVGFDDIRWAAIATPALTTVQVDKYNLGWQAMARLLEMLDNPEATFSPIKLEVKLVIRESA